ncbi:MAG: hypothetical protein LIP08_03040 [Bacteroides sp.]|nr:hypothetical protein [Bacteroides sp.]
MSTVQETDIGRVGIVPIREVREAYDLLDIIARNGRCYLSLKERNSAVVEDPESWMQLTENNYDMAVRLGLFEGTEEEWIPSLSAASKEAAQLATEQIRECKEATEAAIEVTGKAAGATERLNTLSDNRDKIIDGIWHRYNEETKEYENTGEVANGNVLFAVFGIDRETGLLSMETPRQYTGPDFGMNEKGELILLI